MAYDVVPPEVNSELIFGSGRTQRVSSELPEIPSSGIVTVVDIDDDGSVTKVPTIVVAYGLTDDLATDD
jgi:hypothetical protein